MESEVSSQKYLNFFKCYDIIWSTTKNTVTKIQCDNQFCDYSKDKPFSFCGIQNNKKHEEISFDLELRIVDEDHSNEVKKNLNVISFSENQLNPFKKTKTPEKIFIWNLNTRLDNVFDIFQEIVSCEINKHLNGAYKNEAKRIRTNTQFCSWKIYDNIEDQLTQFALSQFVNKVNQLYDQFPK